MPGLAVKPNPLGDIDVTFAAVIQRVLEARSLPAADLFERFDLPPARLVVPHARISIPRFMRLGHAAGRLAGDPVLGLAMGQATRVTDMGMAGLAAAAAPTLGRALATLIRYERLTSYNSRGQSRMIEGNRENLAVFYSISPYNEFNYFVVDAVLARWHRFISWLDPAARALLEVQVEYPARGVEDVFGAVFDCPVHFSAERNALVLDSQALDRPNPLGQPALFATLESYCQKELDKLRSGWALADRVKEELAPRLSGGSPSLGSVAEALGTTPWSLRRALADQGKTYRDLLGETRQELAREYVLGTRLSFTEIAYLLGFSSPAPFHRAFRRWTGMSAGEYRSGQKSFPEAQHSNRVG